MFYYLPMLLKKYLKYFLKPAEIYYDLERRGYKITEV